MVNLLFDNDIAQVISIKQNNGTENIDILQLRHQFCDAKVSLYGGQVLSYQPSGHKDLFWLSKQAHYSDGKAIRGGIPLCWPWFGPFALPAESKEMSVQGNLFEQNTSTVKHGFARLLTWKLESLSADEQGVTLVLSLSGAQQHPDWKHKFELTQTLFFGENFKQTLAMTNLGQENTYYSAALHSYFAVSQPEKISIDALTTVEYFDQLTSQNHCQKQPVSCVGEIDRKYQTNKAISIIDNLWQRKINITSQHCHEWVLWNPGTDLASKMADIHMDGEHEFVCLEAASTTAQFFPAKSTVTMSQEISVEHNIAC